MALEQSPQPISPPYLTYGLEQTRPAPFVTWISESEDGVASSMPAPKGRNAPEYWRYSALLVWKRILTRSRGATAVLAYHDKGSAEEKQRTKNSE